MWVLNEVPVQPDVSAISTALRCMLRSSLSFCVKNEFDLIKRSLYNVSVLDLIAYPFNCLILGFFYRPVTNAKP